MNRTTILASILGLLIASIAVVVAVQPQHKPIRVMRSQTIQIHIVQKQSKSKGKSKPVEPVVYARSSSSDIEECDGYFDVYGPPEFCEAIADQDIEE